MSTVPFGTTSGHAKLVVDREYYATARHLVTRARHVCLASVFIVDLKTGASESEHEVHGLMRFLQQAQWRGVRTRLLVGGSRDNLIIAESAEIARYAALRLGLDCKWLTSVDVRGSHSKLLIADDHVLIGSHNWSAGAFSGQTQDSVLIESAALAAFFSEYIDRQWDRG